MDADLFQIRKKISVFENIRIRVSRLGVSLNKLRAKKEIIWMNSLTYRPWLKKDL